VNSILIGGMGNVLLGDDGLGPYVLRLLESEYTFDDEVELADLGTPALDLTHRIAGRRGVILIDCIASEEHTLGTVLLYDKEALMSAIPAQRLDPHSPALSECLLTAEMLGASPERVWLIGVVGSTFEPGKPLSATVRGSLWKVIDAVIHELKRLGVKVEKKQQSGKLGIWWAEEGASAAVEQV
jgi:hydrogenase maturation protease